MDFDVFFRSARIPIIVYRNTDERIIEYLNKSAELQFSALLGDIENNSANYNMPVSKLLRLSDGELERFQQLLDEAGEVIDFVAGISLCSGRVIRANISASKAELDGAEFVIVFIYQQEEESLARFSTHEISNLIFMASTTEEAIESVLAHAGKTIGADRCYLFESVSETLTSNTYEWCSEGVKSMIDELQELPKDIFYYDDTISRGLVMTEDINTLEPLHRALLEPQGIKALAITPLVFHNEPLGYIGFDDCTNNRQWTPDEARFLQGLSEIMASLIVRRNNERKLDYGLRTLRTVMDNFDGRVFVTNIHTNKLLFANTTFARSVGSTPEELVGQLTSSILRRWSSNACEFDPLGELIGTDGKVIKDNISWEFHNIDEDKWYMVRNTIIKWTDGTDALLEISSDITEQKRYENKLKHDASTDSMTGLYLRERGRQIIQQILDNSPSSEKNCIIFIDLDDLKRTNDMFGHSSGDRMILKTIEFILSNIRRSDSLCRWGGDEFILIMRADEAQAENAMKKIQEQIASYNELKHEEFAIGFSYGIVEIEPSSSCSVDSIIMEADNKMYLNKGK